MSRNEDAAQHGGKMKAGLQMPAEHPDAPAFRADLFNPPYAGPGVLPSEIRPITLSQPGKICFGNGVSSALVDELRSRGLRRPFIVTDQAVRKACGGFMVQFETAGMQLSVFEGIDREPTVSMFEECLSRAREACPDSVIGLGGGSAMDVSKLVAALLNEEQSIKDVFGINVLRRRALFLACVPTTSGTGSEVSPNAILLEESCNQKKGVISPHLVPDVACVDPMLTVSLPASTTAATALDALTHCIEAFANKFAHPIVDVYALEGVRLISGSLLRAIANGSDSGARACLALGSLYGGLCLGPVNTAAVHALAYPLGSRFHVAHGISNAILLPHVMRFNFPSAPDRYAEIAKALGVLPGDSLEETAELGVQRIEELMTECPIPRSISGLRIPAEALLDLARDAMSVTRLLKNNLRPVSEANAMEVYRAAW